MDLTEKGSEDADLKDWLRTEFNCRILKFLDQLNNNKLFNKHSAPWSYSESYIIVIFGCLVVRSLAI
jgi:hypothetical protein